jgi:hypothetical protein
LLNFLPGQVTTTIPAHGYQRISEWKGVVEWDQPGDKEHISETESRVFQALIIKIFGSCHENYMKMVLVFANLKYYKIGSKNASEEEISRCV